MINIGRKSAALFQTDKLLESLLLIKKLSVGKGTAALLPFGYHRLTRLPGHTVHSRAAVEIRKAGQRPPGGSEIAGQSASPQFKVIGFRDPLLLGYL